MTLLSLALVLGQQQAAPTKVLDAGEIAARLAEKDGSAVVALVDDSRVPEMADLGDAAKAGGARLLAGKPDIVFPDHLPLSRFPLLGGSPRQEAMKAVEFSSSAISTTGVTFSTGSGESLSIPSLAKANWGMPLTISTAFDNVADPSLRLAVNTKELDKLEFLRAIAKAVGGRFRQTSKGYVIEPNGSELKSRAAKSVEIIADRLKKNPNTMNEQPAMMPMNEDGGVQIQIRRGRREQPETMAERVAGLAFTREVILAADVRSFEAMMAGDASSVVINLAGNTALQQSLVKAAQAQANAPSEVGRLNRTLSSVSPQNPGSITLTNGFEVSATLNVLDRRGNLSPVNVKI